MLTNLKVIILDISQNKLQHIDTDLSNTLEVDMITTDDYRICCLMASTHTLCPSKPKWPQSCKVILDKLVAKVAIVLEFVFILLLNCLSIIFVYVKTFSYLMK